jgi:dipeptidyl aminopeptidase/acylaminoacyl peptidase
MATDTAAPTIHPHVEPADVIRSRLPRMLISGVDHNDFRALEAEIGSIDDWAPAWCRIADMHDGLGDAALAAGHALSAGRAFERAALYYHIAQSVYFADPAEKLRMQQRQRALYGKAAPHLAPPATVIDIPFEGFSFPGNLRLPVGTTPERPAPVMMLTCGADSTKEEFHTLENEFLERGVGTLSYDGPGQGATRELAPLRPDWETVIAAVCDRLESEPGVDGGRLGIWGRSYGGYAAPRAAQEPRIRAAISAGGCFDFGDLWDRFPSGVHEALGYGYGAKDFDEARAIAETFTLKGVTIDCPLLVVHSGQDTVCPVEESEKIAAVAGDKAEMVIFPEGNHVCDNIPYKVRPLMADWMADKLGAAV